MVGDVMILFDYSRNNYHDDDDDRQKPGSHGWCDLSSKAGQDRQPEIQADQC